METANYLGERIAAELRAELARQGQNGGWLALQSGISKATIYRWLSATTAPDLNELDVLCRALGVSIPDLLDSVNRAGGYTPTPKGGVPKSRNAPLVVRHQGLEPRTRWYVRPSYQLPYPGQRVGHDAIVRPLRKRTAPIIVRTDGTPVERAA